MNLKDKQLLILDGACGTSIQNMILPDSVWDDNEGCNEYLCLTAPDRITEMHLSFLKAGADVIETNSFGATSIVLGEYGLQDRVKEINTAAVRAAQKAVEQHGSGWVAGSVGPGTKLPSLGHITVEALAASYKEQIEALVDAGVDLLLLETAQDILQLKTVLVTCYEVLDEKSLDIPVMVSVTIESTGTMLGGTDIAAAAAIIEPFPVLSFGLNCATGPEDMLSTIRWLSHNWPGRISCLPNQGLPQIVDGKTTYPMSPEAYARELKTFIGDWGVSLAGGCCGTTPQHIIALKKALAGTTPAKREVLP
ncbi:homocysteine S-methyltransferase family protein [Oceanispirochaeta sp.]|uniref:homocysteine S-methyltransferase family protein n=1 Tax=Oceanispirochaeta sp. TaxID=2035350 RepID=UPI0026323BAA|nr:homocysteine S-methyltransferase family protein [Oceanispirochaeta sp.]MDA3957763.1 homocysteine S-methyltransferase family protein [Oceanispirochaeta sp.]